MNLRKAKLMNTTGPPVDSANADAVDLPDTPLWHYTDTGGLLGILSNVDKKAENGRPGSETYKPVLRASAAQFLNDRRELVHGLNLVKDYLDVLVHNGSFVRDAKAETFFRAFCDTITKITDQTYDEFIHCSTISFSLDPDLLSQWRAYGHGTSGFAIGFDPAAFPRSSGRVHQGGLGLHQVQYTSDTLENPLLAAVDLFIEQTLERPEKAEKSPLYHAVRRMSYIAASVKHKGFAEEQEWRYVDSGRDQLPDFRSGATGLIPYRNLELPAESVVGLSVGPGPQQYENYLAARSMLRRYGYIEAAHNVQRSSSPFR